ncbi:hypothetical protein VTK73DRAFT_1653 [Phialemonium thermophilum]|uniref:Uncharacterized protein n=1 Tax=Phialemonium thermophilum TaxID=223376 RepID=A0ABR3VT49_9PEZI
MGGSDSRYLSSMSSCRNCSTHSSRVRVPTCRAISPQSSSNCSSPSSSRSVSASLHGASRSVTVVYVGFSMRTNCADFQLPGMRPSSMQLGHTSYLPLLPLLPLLLLLLLLLVLLPLLMLASLCTPWWYTRVQSTPQLWQNTLWTGGLPAVPSADATPLVAPAAPVASPLVLPSVLLTRTFLALAS